MKNPASSYRVAGGRCGFGRDGQLCADCPRMTNSPVALSFAMSGSSGAF